MAFILTNLGEEFYQRTLTGEVGPLTDSDGSSSVDVAAVGLYDNSSYDVSDSDNIGDIGTAEPDTGKDYNRQTDVDVSPSQDSNNDYQITNDNPIVFNLGTNDSGDINAYFILVNFASNIAGTTSDHLIATGDLSQKYTLSNVDELTIASGTAGISLT